MELSDSGEPIEQLYHVILHYEEIIEAECKFDATHNIRMGNTVVENSKIAEIESALDSKTEPLERSALDARTLLSGCALRTLPLEVKSALRTYFIAVIGSDRTISNTH